MIEWNLSAPFLKNSFALNGRLTFHNRLKSKKKRLPDNAAVGGISPDRSRSH